MFQEIIFLTLKKKKHLRKKCHIKIYSNWQFYFQKKILKTDKIFVSIRLD